MSALEPGEKFTITYGKAKKPLEVIALSGRQKRRALQCMASTAEAKTPETVMAALEELEAVVKICSPGISEEVLDTLDDTLQVNIITATLMQTRLSEGEEKKSE
jgi:hypothetical protein